MPSLSTVAPRSVVLGLLTVLAWGGESASLPIVDVTKALAAISAAADRSEAGVPVWIADPSMGGKFLESAVGTGGDLGSAWISGLKEVAATRTTRSAAAAGAQQPTPAAFGELKLQAFCRNSVKEGGDITATTNTAKTSSVFESVVRLVHPTFTVQISSAEEGELTAKADTNRTTLRTLWTSKVPLTGAVVAKACAAGGLVLTAQAIPDKQQPYVWVVALPVPVPVATGEGYLLPLQAPAVALVNELRSSGQDHLLGADVLRIDATTVRISWPQGPASLTLRLDDHGAVVGLSAEEVVSSTARPLVALAKESLTAQAGSVTVQRGPCGEIWQIALR